MDRVSKRRRLGAAGLVMVGALALGGCVDDGYGYGGGCGGCSRHLKQWMS